MRARVTAIAASALVGQLDTRVAAGHGDDVVDVTPWSSRRTTRSVMVAVMGRLVRASDVSGRRRRRGRPMRRAGRRAGRPGAGGSARRAARGRRARRARGGRRRSGAGRARRRPSPTRRASAGVIRMSRTATAMQNGMDVVYDEPGLQSVASATVTPASISRRASGYGDAGGELGARQQGRDGVAAGERLDVVVGRRGCSGRPRRRRPRPRPALPAPCSSWLACMRGSRPRAIPARRISRAWSASKAPRSQNTSIQRACGAQASSIAPVTRAT